MSLLPVGLVRPGHFESGPANLSGGGTVRSHNSFGVIYANLFGAMANSGVRVKVASENMVNYRSTSNVPGGDPYRRKQATFESALDRQTGARVLRPAGVRYDQAPFREVYEPYNPAANPAGFVLYPNVELHFELLDIQEANTVQAAAAQVVSVTTAMLSRVYDLPLQKG